ncbi:MAG TPA: peptide-methionine (S)-S-oxide reductase [Alphaproteobacteria bacterium]|nr:peptide-methionine (S)-S-oxide reductase [Rhodospirillaceae bacterium]HAO58732.1 peptide-methionine (S)-S-oxide reductase [Alphaproteobacteria bacterium]MAS74048.1 peptide-methionine (S)-S-oxide reductase [Rhodospirillaceae bacterium]HBD52106.1 peptide-methionine (S)-S-oxide reductase [Alphaproteobacteria bacterium]HCA15197.1 peptide-methionine (S)-S-oxide reductase [Alphaproteobacteria bacterium]
MLFSNPFKARLPLKAEALPGRSAPIFDGGAHCVLGTPTTGPFPDHLETVQLGLGCFWGAERLFWKLKGVYTTAVGYAGGHTPNPTYEEVCSGRTGHSEVVLVVYDPAVISLQQVLKVFFEEHDPTQGYRQGNDIGTQYRSVIYCDNDEALQTARATAKAYGRALGEAGRGQVSTEIEAAGNYYYAEDYHQQYLHKVPNGYCGLKGTGVACITA